MSKAIRREKVAAELTYLETTFRAELIACLRETREGRWGIFGRNDAAWPPGKSKARAELLEMQGTIEALRSELGRVDAFELGERFRAFSAMRGPNDPDEPKLADVFLRELGEI